MLGLFSTLLGGLMGGLGSMMGSQANYAQNAQLMKQQNEYNIDMWKMNNEYNTPQAQMQRFQDAGLNPNLIYSMGTPGNSSAPPQQGVPAPMDHKFAEKIMSAFNIENLKKIRADRRKAEADAKNAELTQWDHEDMRDAQDRIQQLYNYDPLTGRYVFAGNDPSFSQSYNGPRKGAGRIPVSSYQATKILRDNAQNTYLLPYRSALMEHQKNYLVPQIQMANYEAKYQPWSFWIDRANTGTRALGNIVSSVVPLFGGGAASKGAKAAFRTRRFVAPNGRTYIY